MPSEFTSCRGLCREKCGREVAKPCQSCFRAYDTCCKDCATSKGSKHSTACVASDLHIRSSSKKLGGPEGRARKGEITLRSYTYIEKDNCSFVQSKKEDNAKIEWNERCLKLIRPSDDPNNPGFELAWTKVAGIWATVRYSSAKGKQRKQCFTLDVMITTGSKYRAQADPKARQTIEVAHFTADMSDDCGSFLDYIDEDEFEAVVKDGRAPLWLVAPECTRLYRIGVSSHRLRVVVSWASSILDLFFSICFLGAFFTIFGKNLDRIRRQWEEAFKPQSFSELLFDVIMVAVYARGVVATVLAIPRSISSIKIMGQKLFKTGKKFVPVQTHKKDD